MREGDSEWHLAYYALHKLHIKPWEIAEYTIEQKAALYALILERIRAEKEAERKIRKPPRRR